ncbi:LolA family protein [Sneathiella sp. HT1-7]|jgi:outer membrane lipoprotein-sorting protein|uniref:LolA family protein n=1 Tax=Sneathiella sp. HT1-7 TaxID=2887192 RepID=UPI001D150CDF|nr:outer membrane lipoprotein carrier protein LolA [Sneathiella sp. HT1-7]MCC3303725.1 outer membrane lipoprotein carrier protein LolA [Sneathiella sp. HT1-7]
MRFIRNTAQILFAVLIATAVSSPALSAPTTEDQAQIARVEAYLDTIKTMQADFLQIDSAGGIAEGAVFMRKPGRMRFEYKPPAQILVVADGLWLVFHDKELKETTRLPLSATPVSILLEEDVELSGDVTVTKVEHDANTLRLTIVDTDNPDEGNIVLIFSDNPLQLRQWLVTDAQGQVTSISLGKVEKNIKLKPELFTFFDSDYE